MVKIKIKLLLLAILLPPFVFADEQTFTNVVYVVTFNGSMNVTTEQDTHAYNCMSNTTSTFNFNLRRNVSTAIDLTPLNNFTGKVESMASTCDSIMKQYGDVNTYFKLYTTCNVDNSICNKDKADLSSKITELNPFKPNYEKCSKDLSDLQINVNKYSNEIIPSYQQNLTAMAGKTQTAEKSKWLYGIFGFIAASIMFVIIENRKTGNIQREKVMGLNR